MKGSILSRVPPMTPRVKALFILKQECRLCSKYPFLQKSFYCPDRDAEVYKTTRIRLYCGFTPIDNTQLDEYEAAFRARQARWDHESWIRRWAVPEKKEKIKARRKRWRQANPTHLAKYQRDYYAKNAERLRPLRAQQMRAYRARKRSEHAQQEQRQASQVTP